MKKFVSLLLVLALAACMLVSCDTPLSVIEKADKALAEAPYTVTLSMDFDCDNATLNTVFDAMSVEVPVTVDGENMALDMSMDIAGYTMGQSMTVVDRVLYYKLSLAGMDTKVKCTLSDEQFKEFTAENGTEMPVSPDSFETLTMEEKDGKQIIACTGITTEGLTAMNDLISDSLTSLGAEAAVGDLSFTVTVADGKYESMALTASYSVTVSGETYTVALTMNAAYSYDNVQPITAPADADSYTAGDYSDIMG